MSVETDRLEEAILDLDEMACELREQIERNPDPAEQDQIRQTLLDVLERQEDAERRLEEIQDPNGAAIRSTLARVEDRAMAHDDAWLRAHVPADLDDHEDDDRQAELDARAVIDKLALREHAEQLRIRASWRAFNPKEPRGPGGRWIREAFDAGYQQVKSARYRTLTRKVIDSHHAAAASNPNPHTASYYAGMAQAMEEQFGKMSDREKAAAEHAQAYAKKAKREEQP